MAARSLAKRPGFLLVATLSLSVGIGANTAIFSVVNAVFIKQYPYRAPDELVHVYTHVPRRTEYGTTSYPNYKDIKEFNEVFQAVGAYKTILSRVEIRGEAVRALGEAVSQTLFPMLRRMIREVNPALMVMETKTMEDNIAVILFPARMAALLLGVFGVLALALAAIGLYGVVSFSVSQRTREIGIRMSVGANARAVVLTVMAGAMKLVAVGGFIGLAAALGLAQLVRHTLFGVDSMDIATLLAVPLILACAAGVAAWIPARRAGRVDPMVALRYE